MRLCTAFLLALSLYSPISWAQTLYKVEVIFFRQAGAIVPASQIAPEDWAAESQPITRETQRETALDELAAKLTDKQGYRVLIHQAWLQAIDTQPQSSALTQGTAYYGRYPVEAVFRFQAGQSIILNASLWINQMDANGLITSSEWFKQTRNLLPGKLTYIDHGNLGMLIRIDTL